MRPANAQVLLALLALLAAAACNAAAPARETIAPPSALGVRLPRGALPTQPVAPAPAKGDGIARLLDGFEDTPSKQTLLQHGSEDAVVASLAAIAQDPSQPTIRRLRAVSLLGFFHTDGTRQALDTALAGPDLFRREAVTAYANALGEAALPRLTELLGHDDPFTRVLAVQALGRIGTPQALSAVEARVKIEPLETVRSAAGRALAKATH
jgi:hypothetical protein